MTIEDATSSPACWIEITCWKIYLPRAAPPEQVVGDFKAFVEKIRTKLPDVRIAIMSSGPSLDRFSSADKIKKLNQLIKEYVGQGKNLDYIDTFDAFMGPDGLPRPELYVADKTHNSAEGYKIRVSLVKPYVEKFMNEENR